MAQFELKAITLSADLLMEYRFVPSMKPSSGKCPQKVTQRKFPVQFNPSLFRIFNVQSSYENRNIS
jgi:hypothetical protein